jgi:hypothetical protein
MAEDSWTKPTLTEGSTPTTGIAWWAPILSLLDRLAHKATRNAAGFRLSADDVPDYGVGVVGPLPPSNDCNLVAVNSFFSINPSTLHSPGAAYGMGHANFYADGANGYMCVTLTNGSEYKRRKVSGSWDAAWTPRYDYYSDGNLAQPPAPKPTTGTPAGGANAPGQAIQGTVTAGNSVYYSGPSNLTGQWKITAVTFNTSTGAIWTSSTTLGTIGNGFWFTVPASSSTVFYTERQS